MYWVRDINKCFVGREFVNGWCVLIFLKVFVEFSEGGCFVGGRIGSMFFSLPLSLSLSLYLFLSLLDSFSFSLSSLPCFSQFSPVSMLFSLTSHLTSCLCSVFGSHQTSQLTCDGFNPAWPLTVTIEQSKQVCVCVCVCVCFKIMDSARRG